MKTLFKNIIAFRILLPLVVGILLNSIIQLPVWSLVPIILVLAVLIKTLNFSYRFRWGSGVCILLACTCSGLLVNTIHSNALVHAPVGLESKKYDYAVELLEQPTETTKSTKVIAIIIDHELDSLVGQKILVYGISTETPPASRVVISSYLNPISGPKNPGEFNYKKFMARRQVHYSAFVSASGNAVAGSHKELPTKTSFITKLRNHCISFLEKHLKDEELSIGKALLLGQKDDLSAATKQTFSRSGTMHILAVSGLHVGILFLLFNTFFCFLQRKLKYPNVLTPFLLVAVIWVFAILTGGKASVIRAAFMFSLFSFGIHFFRAASSFNILSATAVVMLLINPSYLTDVGFQLSFSAVAGILVLFPMLRNTWPGGPWIWRYFKEITFLSFAAQLSTMPLSIYYFHQMPSLGLLSNLVAIPAAFCIVSSGFLGFIFGQIPILGDVLGFILSMSIQVIQFSNEWISGLSFSAVTNIEWNSWEVGLVYVALITFIAWMKLKQRNAFVVALCCMLCFFGSKFTTQHRQLQNKAFIVYDISGGSALEVFSGKESVLFVNGDIDASKISYSIQPNQSKLGIKHTQRIPTDSIKLFTNHFVQYSYPFIRFEDQLIQIGEEEPLTAAQFYVTNNPQNKWFKNRNSSAENMIVTNKYPSKYLEVDTTMYFTRLEGAFRWSATDNDTNNPEKKQAELAQATTKRK